MLSLEEVLLNLKARDTISLAGEQYKVNNVIAATDGKILKAHIILIKPGEVDFCVNIDISTRVHEHVDLSSLKI